MAKKKQRGFKMFDPGGPLVIPESATPSYMAPATDLEQAPRQRRVQLSQPSPLPQATPPSQPTQPAQPAQPLKGPQDQKTPGMDLSQIGGVLQGALGLYETISGNRKRGYMERRSFVENHSFLTTGWRRKENRKVPKKPHFKPFSGIK